MSQLKPLAHIRIGVTYLIAVSPREVLHADVLVRVLGTLLKRGHVFPVFPVLVPEVVGVETTTNQARNHGTIQVLICFFGWGTLKPRV